MKKLNYYISFVLFCSAIVVKAQCSFQYISNDTTFQDYIEYIYPLKNNDQIITIGSRVNRGIINDSIFNAPVFQIFDYCGNILKKKIYDYIGNAKLKHKALLTDNTYNQEPISNTVVNIDDSTFIFVDKAFDTILNKPVMILIQMNQYGDLSYYKTLVLDNHEANETEFKNILELKDGNFMIILYNYPNEYNLYFFVSVYPSASCLRA